MLATTERDSFDVGIGGGTLQILLMQVCRSTRVEDVTTQLVLIYASCINDIGIILLSKNKIYDDGQYRFFLHNSQ